MHPGQLVYKSYDKVNAKEIHHVGVYIGGGYVIEAKGHEEGIVKTKFDGAGWTHWSQCPYIADDSQTGGASYSSDREGSYEVDCKSVYIREGAGPSYKALGVLKRGARATCDGHFAKVSSAEWLKVTSTLNGKTAEGWVSGKYLKKL